jgi:hypothetical protein
MPAPTDDTVERRRALADFELLLTRPANYFRVSAERQWDIDKTCRTLDSYCDERYITDEMRTRWNAHFGFWPQRES